MKNESRHEVYIGDIGDCLNDNPGTASDGQVGVPTVVGFQCL